MERLLAFCNCVPSPAGGSGKHNRLDSRNHPYPSGALLGVLRRQSGTPGQNPCRRQGCTSSPLGLWHRHREVPLPGCPLVGAGGHLLAPCHPAGWSLITVSSCHIPRPLPSSNTETPLCFGSPKAPACAPSHDPGHDAAGLGIACASHRLFQGQLCHSSLKALETWAGLTKSGSKMRDCLQIAGLSSSKCQNHERKRGTEE